MSRNTVWLRRDPVGSHTRLPSRAQFRRYQVRRAFVFAAGSLASLTALLALDWADRLPGAWRPLVALSFCLGIAGIGAAAVSLRMRELRGQAIAALTLSVVATALVVVLPSVW